MIVATDVTLGLDGRKDRKQGVKMSVLNGGRIRVVHDVMRLGIRVGERGQNTQ